MRALLAAAVYVEVAKPLGPLVLDRIKAPVSLAETVACMEGKCDAALHGCTAAPVCADRLHRLWHKVPVAQMTEPESDLMACMMHASCVTRSDEGWHGSVHRVMNGTQAFAWRQSGGTKGAWLEDGQKVAVAAEGSVDKATAGALTATALRCPGVVPALDAKPEVRLRSGEVTKTGFIMPLMDGNMEQWIEDQSAATRSQCLDSFAVQVGGALACLHARGYTHGDVQGHNFVYKAAAGGCPHWGLIDFERLRARQKTDHWARRTASDWRRFAMALQRMELGPEAGDLGSLDLAELEAGQLAGERGADHPRELRVSPVEPAYPLTMALFRGVESHTADATMRDFLQHHALLG